MDKRPNVEDQLGQLLDIIQKGMKKQHLNTAALANSIEMDRKDLKRILTGQKEITIRDFMRISMALNLDASLLEEYSGTQEKPTSSDNIEPMTLSKETDDSSIWEPNAFGNHTRQLIAYGFSLGCNMMLLCSVNKLSTSNVPKEVLERFHPHLPIQLEAEYQPYNKPQYFDEGLELKLSFDALYTCFFPWNSIIQVVFRPSIEDEEEETEGPTLRLV